MNSKEIAQLAFHMHEKDQLSQQKLVDVLRECVNANALKNGYADEHGLPCEHRRRRRSRRAP